VAWSGQADTTNGSTGPRFAGLAGVRSQAPLDMGKVAGSELHDRPMTVNVAERPAGARCGGK